VSTLVEVLDGMIAFAAADEGELVRAREEWGEAAGRVFDDDPLYEERTAAFLEWYTLDRTGPDGRTPAERFTAAEGAPAETGDPERARWARTLARSHRSLFRVQRLHEDGLVVDDLLGGGAFDVTERRRLDGFEEEEIFEARLVADVERPPAVLFGRSFQFHPREARREILRHVQRATAAMEPRAATLFRLLRLRLKAVRYRHVPPDKIYEADDAS
jgi:hypothetical protein